MEAEVPVPVAGKPPKRGMWWFLLLLALCNLIWATQPTAIKFIQDQLGPIAIAFLPFYLTTVLLVPLLVWKRRANPHAVRPTWSDWKKFVAIGVGGQVVAQLCGVWGATQTLASNCAILALLTPVITAVLASIMLRERITSLRVGCLALGLAGVLLMSKQELQQSAFLKSRHFLGNVLIFGSCTGSAFYNVYCKGLLARFQEVEILVFGYIIASLASVGVLLWWEPDCFARLALLNWQGWVVLAFLAFFMYGVSMLLLFYVLQYLPVTVASASLYLFPVFGVLIAMLLLGERLHAWQVAGAALVLVPTVVIMRYDRAE